MSQIPRVLPISLLFPWSQLKLGSFHLWLRLDSRLFLVMMHLLDPKERYPFVSAPLRWNPLLFTENRILQSNKHSFITYSLGPECPRCEWVCVWSGPDWLLKQPSIYTAGARPTLLFFRLKIEKYNLRKTSPRTQVSGPLKPSEPPAKLLMQRFS